MKSSHCLSCPSGSVSQSKSSLARSGQLAPPGKTPASKLQRPAAKAPTGDTKRKDLGVPSKGQSPARQSYLPQGSSSSDWRPPSNPWEQQLQPYWEPYPVVNGEWQGEWASSNPHVTRHPWRSPSRLSKARGEQKREVRFASPPEEGQGPSCPSTVDNFRSPPHRKETTEEREGSADEHLPHQGLARTRKSAQYNDLQCS